jgi:hypothetical protein
VQSYPRCTLTERHNVTTPQKTQSRRPHHEEEMGMVIGPRRLSRTTAVWSFFDTAFAKIERTGRIKKGVFAVCLITMHTYGYWRKGNKGTLSYRESEKGRRQMTLFSSAETRCIFHVTTTVICFSRILWTRAGENEVAPSSKKLASKSHEIPQGCGRDSGLMRMPRLGPSSPTKEERCQGWAQQAAPPALAKLPLVAAQP